MAALAKVKTIQSFQSSGAGSMPKTLHSEWDGLNDNIYSKDQSSIELQPWIVFILGEKTIYSTNISKVRLGWNLQRADSTCQ